MENSSAQGLLHFLQQLPDPRGREGQRHPHVAMLAAFVCATLCGFDGYAGVAQWLRLQPLAFWHALGGKRNPPCPNAFRYLLMQLCPEQFEQTLNRWIAEGLGLSIGEEELQKIVFDGKALRGTRARHVRAMMIVAALDVATGCVLSQTRVDETTEAKAVLPMLHAMVFAGKVFLGDAAYCERTVCETVVENGGDYLVLVKDNQPKLHHAAQQSFVIPKGFSPLCAAEGGRETRLRLDA